MGLFHTFSRLFKNEHVLDRVPKMMKSMSFLFLALQLLGLWMTSEPTGKEKSQLYLIFKENLQEHVKAESYSVR